MRRVKGEYENLKNLLADLKEKMNALGIALNSAGNTAAVDLLRVIAKRIGNIRSFSTSLGSTAPGLDEATLRKISAELSVCRRMAANATDLAYGQAGRDFAAAMKAYQSCLESLLG